MVAIDSTIELNINGLNTSIKSRDCQMEKKEKRKKTRPTCLLRETHSKYKIRGWVQWLIPVILALREDEEEGNT